VTGYQRLDDEAVQARLRALWGVSPPERPGLTIPEMLAAARAGTLRALWVAGEDLAQSDPDQSRVLEALGELELLIVQDPFLAETSRLAHLVLPSATALEQEGTFTNAERRIQHVRPAIAPPGEARADWEVVASVARALGLAWSYASPAAIMDEIAKVAPALFGGVRYDRLGSDGLQWPCPDPTHPGTTTLHEREFLRGRGQLVAIEQAPETAGAAEYPYVLVTGRTLHQYNVGTMTRRTPQQELAPRDMLELHPDDAAREGIAEGSEVLVESVWGSVRVPARHSLRVLAGTLFLTFHQPETHANRVIGPDCDPLSKCPSYKVTAVRIAIAR
jgi:predicted molibdopterin-dependent oxidoreductase YjgC